MSTAPISAMPTEAELLLRLSSTEDNFVERKTFGDWRADALKTVVAFANSTPVGYPAILFIGAQNDGTPQNRGENLDKIQKTLSETLNDIYPPVYHLSRILKVNGIEILAVVVPGSPDRPHFAGPAYIRVGSKSVRSSEKLFDELIAQRTSIVRELLKWKGKRVTLSRPQHFAGSIIRYYTQERVLDECDTFMITLSFPPMSGTVTTESFPISALQLSFDHQASRPFIHIRDASFATG